VFAISEDGAAGEIGVFDLLPQHFGDEEVV
jgi:hypothetical protein